MARPRHRRRAVRALRQLTPTHYRNVVRPALRRARCVDRRLRFVVRELRKAPVVGSYRVKSGLCICIRHDTIDAFLVDEVFATEQYRLPTPVAAYLGSRSKPRIVDVGANIGLFGVWILGQFPNAAVVAFEPDPANAAVHERCITANDDRLDWTLHRTAAATSATSIALVAEGSPLSRIAAPDEPGAMTVPTEDVLPYFEGADLVKMDVEGAEWPILCDERFTSVRPPTLVLEYHRPGCPSDDPRGLAFELLEGAGYVVQEVPPAAQLADPAGAGTLWAWRHIPSGG